VIAGAAKNHVVAVTAGNCVGATEARVRRRGARDLSKLELSLTEVAQNEVVAEAAGDRIAPVAADSKIVAETTIDVVRVSVRRVGGLNAREETSKERAEAVVAEDHVVAAVSADLVLARAAENDVVAVAARNRIIAAERGVSGVERCDVSHRER